MKRIIRSTTGERLALSYDVCCPVLLTICSTLLLQQKKVKTGKLIQNSGDHQNGNPFDLFRQNRHDSGNKSNFVDRSRRTGHQWRARFPGRGHMNGKWKRHSGGGRQRHDYR